jgi:dUTP pyrophosphatase
MSDVTIAYTKDPATSDVPDPAYMSEHASGMDVCAAVTEAVVLEPGTRTLVPTGLKFAIPPGYEVQVRPRSGLALKHGIMVVNSPGTVDADYRGEIGIILGNCGAEPFTIERGMRVAQIVVQPVVQASMQNVAELDETARNEGGFGSSGV